MIEQSSNEALFYSCDLSTSDILAVPCEVSMLKTLCGCIARHVIVYRLGPMATEDALIRQMEGDG